MNTKSAGWTNSRVVNFFISSPIRFWITFIFLFALSRLGTWGYPFDSDHWIFFYVGNEWVVNGGQLYIDAWDHKPPLIFLYNGVMAALFGDNIVLHRMWFTAFAVLDTWLFYRIIIRFIPQLMLNITTRVNPTTAIKLTLLLYVVLRNLTPFASNGNTTENLGLVFLLAMILCYLRFSDNRSWGWIAFSGFFAANLFWVKGNLILLGGVIGLMLLISGRNDKRKLALHVAAFIAPILLVSGFWMAYFWSQGNFAEFSIAAFTFSAKYASSAWAGKVSANIVLILITAATLIPTIIFLIVYARDAKAQYKSPAYSITGLSLLVGLALIGAVGSFYSYYLLIIIPFITIVMMYGLFRLDALSRILRAFLVAIFVATLIVNSAVSLRFLANNFTGITKQEANEFANAADYVQSHSEPGDTVFAYDYGATFYVLSERDSGTRFISASHLLLDYRDHFGFGFDDIFISEMEQNHGVFVILNDRSRELYFTNKPIAEYITSQFSSVAKFGSIEVLERTN